MNAHVTPPRGTVALVGLAPPDLDSARDAAVLAGVRVCSNPGQASLILASASAPVPEGVPCVRVGQGGQVSLPGDTALLVSLIAEACARTRRSGAVWAVAGIAGGVGVTGIVRLLARERGRRRGVRGGVRRGERGARRARSGAAVAAASIATDRSTRSTRRSPRRSGLRNSWRVMTALDEAWAPPRWPPIPSATAKTGGTASH